MENVTPNQASQEVEIAILKTQMTGVKEQLTRIETNHLVHLNDNLTKLNDKVDTKFSEMQAAIVALKVTDAGSAPGQNLFWDIVKFAVMALVAAAIGAVIGSKV